MNSLILFSACVGLGLLSAGLVTAAKPKTGNSAMRSGRNDSDSDSHSDSQSDSHSDSDSCDDSSGPDCADQPFYCADGIGCVDNSAVCDGTTDCLDGSDEANCDCGRFNFKCDDGTCFYDTSLVCDGKNDCPDGSDESHCDGCAADEFTCFDAGCVNNTGVCRGTNSIKHKTATHACADGSEEKVCGGCPTFPCDDGSCISRELVCNGNPDCFDGSDESTNTCRTTSTNTWINCTNGREGPTGQNLCNFGNACKDWSDESPKFCGCGTNKFKCSAELCLPAHMVCDGVEHCPDGADEEHCVGQTAA